MPIIKFPLQDTKDSIMRPIMTDITTQLNIKMGFPADLPILYADEAGVIMQHRSTLKKEYQNEPHGAKFNANELITIEVDEVFDDEVASTPVWQTEYMPVFRDDALNIIMKPVYMPCVLNINYKYRTKDRAHAEMWRNTIRSKMSDYGHLTPHNLKYHYLIPDVFIEVLRKIHEFRENIDGYNESFMDYLTSKGLVHGSVRLTTLSNFKGHNKRLAITENQTRVFGQFEFDVVPDRGGRDMETTAWVTNFSYRVRYTRPTQMVLMYPLMVHQQLLPVPYIPSGEDKMTEVGLGDERHFSLSGLNLEMFSAQEERRRRAAVKGISIPDFDEFVPKDTIKGARRIYDVMLSLSNKEPNDLIHIIDDIEDMTFGELMVEFMQGESKYMHKRGESVFQVQLYNQWSQLHESYISVKEDLTLASLKELTLRNCYHVRLSVYHDWTQLSANALKRLQNHPKIVKGLLDFLGIDIGLLNQILSGMHEKYHHIDTENALRGIDAKVWRNEQGVLTYPPKEDEYTIWDKWHKVPDHLWWEVIQRVSNTRFDQKSIFTVQTQFIDAHNLEGDRSEVGIYYY